MRLSQIKLAGFKSFVDPTHILTPGRIVGIVGPNGCGKSNIIDALRWVLGESKASALRGKSMQDVIFNGSGNRKPVARASVELVFDNSLGRAAGQWSNYSEIAVKRILQRDAESSYFINNIRVRRKDVADIFLGTGLGGHAYAIIEQGMISRIIEADPEELKVFLEEAAGISKYRERRRETELRLSSTRENLLRVEDIVRELHDRIEHLESQASVARIYHELQRSLKTTQNLYWLTRRTQASTLRLKLFGQIADTETEMEAEIAGLRRLENELVQMRDGHDCAMQKLQRLQGEMYEANAEVSRLQQQIDHVRESRKRLEARIGASEKDLAGFEQQYAQALEDRELLELELTQAQHGREQLILEFEGRKTAFAQADEKAKAARRSHGEARNALSSSENELKVEQAHWGHVQRNLEDLSRRREKLAESKRLLPRADEEKLAVLEQEISKAESALHSEREASGEIAERLDRVRSARQTAASQLGDAERENAGIRARLAALQEVQTHLEKDSALESWLAEREYDRLPRLWARIRIASGWENALEAVLRERVNAVLTASSEIPPEEMVFAVGAQPTPKPERSSGLVPLLGLVELEEEAFGGALHDWLSGVYIAQDPEEAGRLRASLEPGECLVTPEGHVFTRYSIHYYGEHSNLRGVLLRQQEIEGLLLQEHATAISVEEARTAQRALDEELSELEHASKIKRSLLAGLDQRRHDLQLQRIRLSETNSRILEQFARIESELEEIESRHRIEQERIEEIGKKLDSLQKGVEASRESLDAIRQGLNDAERAFEACNRQMQQAQMKTREAEFQEKSCSVKIEELTKRTEFLSGNLAQSRAGLDALKEEIATLDEGVLANQLQQSLAIRQNREEALSAGRKESEELSATLKEIDAMRQRSELKIAPMRDKIGEYRLKEQEARLAEEQFDSLLKAEGAKEEELSALLGSAPDAKQLQGEMTKLNGKIESLGAVNLAAFEELENAQERKQHLDSQTADLSEAVETLENAIRRIDRETRERLMATYGEVNRNFGELFYQMFGGGQAKLVLTGEQIIDCGMEIEAQPPGKKNASIRLLSGGEKALTALSLVFALFKLNPAPFCLLDEVDAPLDDSNTERFCDMVRKMAENTQFLFISHNKITMEMAQQLVGVTMQEQGVSRIVAVDVEAASRQSGVIMAN